jgi:hypothetical protein
VKHSDRLQTRGLSKNYLWEPVETSLPLSTCKQTWQTAHYNGHSYLTSRLVGITLFPLSFTVFGIFLYGLCILRISGSQSVLHRPLKAVGLPRGSQEARGGKRSPEVGPSSTVFAYLLLKWLRSDTGKLVSLHETHPPHWDFTNSEVFIRRVLSSIVVQTTVL